MRYTLMGGNDIANGGYPAQHELLVTGMYAIAKRTPRIWSQLTASEQAAVDATMEASLVASAFTTSDAKYPYVTANAQQYTLDADSNVNRELESQLPGGHGRVRGGGDGSYSASRRPRGCSQGTLTPRSSARLQAAGLTNAHATFTWKTANPSSVSERRRDRGRRSLVRVPRARHELAAGLSPVPHGQHLRRDRGVRPEWGGGDQRRQRQVQRTHPPTGCSTLPNLGKAGMLLEFDSGDAQGVRSDSGYAYSGYKPNLVTQLVLVVSGRGRRATIADKESSAR